MNCCNFKYNYFPGAGPLTKAPGKYSWQDLMHIALHEAFLAAEKGEVPVGALIISENGIILSCAANSMESCSNPCAHAEILCIQQACKKIGSLRLANCFLVCTLEPCLMCAAAAAHAHISGIIYGASDPQAGAISSCADFAQLPLANKRIWYMGGILGIECSKLLNNFFISLRKTNNTFNNRN